jgi:hypothetical protein
MQTGNTTTAIGETFASKPQVTVFIQSSKIHTLASPTMSIVFHRVLFLPTDRTQCFSLST